jgi:hypothetical protein
MAGVMVLSNFHADAATRTAENLIAAVAETQAELARTDEQLLATVGALQEAVAGILEEIASLSSAAPRAPGG